jgi:hypothetical protein
MDEERYRRLEDRIARLERRQRTGAVLLLAAGVGAVAASVAATGPVPPVLEAQEFLLRDPAGHVRARLGLSAELRAAPAASPAPGVTARDPEGLLDREKNPSPRPPEELSSTCLTFLSPSGAAAARQCASWEEEASHTLAFASGGRSRILISADGSVAAVRIGEAKSRSNPGRGVNVTLGAFLDGASVLVTDPAKGRALLTPESLEVTDRSGKTIAACPRPPGEE